MNPLRALPTPPPRLAQRQGLGREQDVLRRSL